MRRLSTLLLLAAVSAAPAYAGGVTLTVEGLRNDKGNVLILVFDTAAGFEEMQLDAVIDYAQIPARAGAVKHAFPSLEQGPYAVFVLHDEDADADLDYQADALLEGIGATGAPGPNDYPSFKDASVWPGSVTVKIHYDK